jgi:threonine/homoserine/homoserine lactone efflux protein
MEFTVSIEFLITSFIIVVSLGIGVLFAVAMGLTRGARVSIVRLLGVRSVLCRILWRQL